MSNNGILFLVVKRALLYFILRMLAADSLVNEDQDNEANDACETKKHYKQCLLTLFFIFLFIDFDSFTFIVILSSWLPPEICVDYKFECTAKLAIHLLVFFFVRGAIGECGRKSHEADGKILFWFLTELNFNLFGWLIVPLSEQVDHQILFQELLCLSLGWRHPLLDVFILCQLLIVGGLAIRVLSLPFAIILGHNFSNRGRRCVILGPEVSSIIGLHILVLFLRSPECDCDGAT